MIQETLQGLPVRRNDERLGISAVNHDGVAECGRHLAVCCFEVFDHREVLRQRKLEPIKAERQVEQRLNGHLDLLELAQIYSICHITQIDDYITVKKLSEIDLVAKDGRLG